MVECLAQRVFPLLHGTIHILLQLLNQLTAKIKVCI